MPSWSELLVQIRNLRNARVQNDQDLYAIQLRLRDAQQAAERAARKETPAPTPAQKRTTGQTPGAARPPGTAQPAKGSPSTTQPGASGPGSATAATNPSSLTDDYKRAKAKYIQSVSDLSAAVGAVYTGAGPQDVVKNLRDDIPFLLLPVRIETRFVTDTQPPELWVRVYPDDIAIHTHETVLTADEVSQGEIYWTALWDARAAGGDQEDTKKNAWSTLAGQFGPQRAAWVAHETRPTNWSTPLDSNGQPVQPHFPAHNLTKTSSWSRAPRTNVMPDKFVVMLFDGDTIVQQVTGNQIPDELIVGPDPMEEADAFVMKDGKLLFGDAFSWSSDFDKAVANGMGFRIPITAQQVSTGFSRVLVLGLSLSADENDAQKQIETLIDNHHYSPKGFSIVRQGTPTNNTDTADSGYTKNDQFDTISYYVETGDPLFTAADVTDAHALADALGIEYAPLQYIRNADTKDIAEAVDMNMALYPTTLGFYFGTLLQPVLDDASQAVIRDFFIQHVTGRGPLPAVRVGNQPYGVLLTSDFSKWQWGKDDPGSLPTFHGLLLATLQKYQAIWTGLLDEIPYVGKPGTESDPGAAFMNILGLTAASVSFDQRVAYSTDYLRNLDDFQFGGQYFTDMAKTFTSKNAVLLFLHSLGYNVMNPDGGLQSPQLLRLVYQHYFTPIDTGNLIDNVPLAEDKLIRYYDETAKKNYLNWLAEARTVAALESQDFGTGRTPPNTLLYLMLRRALLLELHASTVQWFGGQGIDLSSTSKAANFYNIRPQPDVTKWEVMKAKVGVAQPYSLRKDTSVGDYLLTTGKNEQAGADLLRIRQALTRLSQLPTARLERGFVEHLDACTYRLDSWQTAMFSTRLDQQRRGLANPNNPEGRKKGIFLGAYGWVENLHPSASRVKVRGAVPPKLVPPNNEPLYQNADNGGFVHAPSLNQASAAAVLRSGYLTNAQMGHPDILSVNLSSSRVRVALALMQGIRNGQPLEALLGYQFERGLHDAATADASLIRLNGYIYDFRDAFPMNRSYVQQQGGSGPVEAVLPVDVVNGLRLAQAAGDPPYGATGSVASATPAELAAIGNVKDSLANALDAVSDLLQSESVYQMVQGNPDRASAVINALKDATAPPEIDIIRTPRSAHFTFTNRVTIEFSALDPNDPASNPWTPVPMTPRARFEPGLNTWLTTFLGMPGDVSLRVSALDAQDNVTLSADITLDTLGIQPVDLLYIIGEQLNTGAPQHNAENKTSASQLEMRIAWYFRTANGLDDTTTAKIEFLKPDGKKTLGALLPLLRMVRGVITHARPTHARDYDSPSKPSSLDPANPEAYDVNDLTNRTQSALMAYQQLLASIQAISIDATVEDKNGDPFHYFTLQTAFAAVKEAATSFAQVEFVFADPSAALLQAKLLAASVYGLSDAFPRQRSITGNPAKALLLDQARSVASAMETLAGTATKAIADAAAATTAAQKVSMLVPGAKALLGAAFTVLPRFAFNNEPDIQQSYADRAQLVKYATGSLGMVYPAEEWVQSIAQVRPAMSRWDSVLSIYEWSSGERLGLQPVQVPYRASDSWLAVEFPAQDPLHPDQPFSIVHDTLSVVVHGDAAFIPGTSHSGLLVDDWTELIPTQSETTGISFNYKQPNAMPPQALLLAVTPAPKGYWTWDDLVGILQDTLLRAKLRAVEPLLLDALDKPEVGVLLPALLADFAQYDMNIALDYRLAITVVAEEAPIMVAK